jgi:hypothetical protein
MLNRIARVCRMTTTARFLRFAEASRFTRQRRWLGRTMQVGALGCGERTRAADHRWVKTAPRCLSARGAEFGCSKRSGSDKGTRATLGWAAILSNSTTREPCDVATVWRRFDPRPELTLPKHLVSCAAQTLAVGGCARRLEFWARGRDQAACCQCIGTAGLRRGLTGESESVS